MTFPARLKFAAFLFSILAACSNVTKSAISLALLTLAVDPFGDGLARVGAMPRYDIPLQDMRLILRLMRERSGPAAGKMRDVAVDEGLSVEGRTGLARLAADLDGVHSGILRGICFLLIC